VAGSLCSCSRNTAHFYYGNIVLHISRDEGCQSFGAHLDMQLGRFRHAYRIRTDILATLFLSAPEDDGAQRLSLDELVAKTHEQNPQAKITGVVCATSRPLQ
jgi:hypothetical protein